MSVVLSTYSAKDLNFSLISPIGANIVAAGVEEKGFNEISVRMTTDQTVLKVGADGAVVPSAVPGDQGEIEMQVWQTSTLQQELLAWYNLLKAARDTGDVSNWNTTTIFIQNIVDGSSHLATGVAPTKVPDKAYATEAGTINWVFRACNIVNQ